MNTEFRIKNKINISDIPIDNISLNEATEKIFEFLKSDRCRQVATVNPEFIIEAQKNHAFRKILQNTDLNVADGTGILLASKILHKNKIKERVTGIDLINEIAAQSPRKYKWFLLGGSRGVAKKAGNYLQKKYPQVEIVGAEHGGIYSQMNYAQIQQIVKSINDSGADILLVAFGHPKQEIFINSNLEKLKCKVAIGVGGSFDFLAGAKKRAPKFMRNLGLEWLWRLAIEPSRWPRILTATLIFIKKVYNIKKSKLKEEK